MRLWGACADHTTAIDLVYTGKCGWQTPTATAPSTVPCRARPQAHVCVPAQQTRNTHGWPTLSTTPKYVPRRAGSTPLLSAAVKHLEHTRQGVGSHINAARTNDMQELPMQLGRGQNAA